MATANHFWLDAVAGALAALLGLASARVVGPMVRDRGRPHRVAPTGDRNARARLAPAPAGLPRRGA